MNKVFLMGRMTSDPELRYTQNNTAVCRFSIAVDKPTKQGEERQADFFKVTAWKQTGEFAAKYFQKGVRVLVEGHLINNNYEDKNGTKHFSNDVVAEKIYFADGKQPGQNTQPAQSQEGFAPLSIEDDDLPF